MLLVQIPIFADQIWFSLKSSFKQTLRKNCNPSHFKSKLRKFEQGNTRKVILWYFIFHSRLGIKTSAKLLEGVLVLEGFDY